MPALRIGFIGIGLMGGPMARALLRAGFGVTAWNRTRAKAEALSGDGAAVASSAPDCAREADVLVTMLENGAIVEEVLFGLGAAEALAKGSIVLDMSSIGVAEARGHAARLAGRGIGHIDAPVSGGTVAAEAGTLSIMAGGERQSYERVQEVLAAMGRPILVGPAGAEQIAKLANQTIVATTIGAVAEALYFAERAGADPVRVREALLGGFAASRILELHGQRMIERDFAARGKTSSQIKDLENALLAGGECGAPAPYAELSTALFRALLAREGDVDHSGLWLELAGRAEGG
ncbi:NAD(P)-dependent oxidoreductase [soil metagenome]